MALHGRLYYYIITLPALKTIDVKKDWDMTKRMNDYVNAMIEEWGSDNTFYGLSHEGQLIEQWTTDLDGLEIYYSYVRNSKWVKVIVLPTETGIRPERDLYKWKGCINEWIAETAVWWAFELLTENEAKAFMMKNKPVVKFQFIRSGHPHELAVKFDGYHWVVIDD